MPADNRKDVRKFFRELNCPLTTLELRPDANDLRYACGVGALHHFGQIGGEIGIIKMGMGVVEYSHTKAGEFNAKALRRKGEQARDRKRSGSFYRLLPAQDIVLVH